MIRLRKKSEIRMFPQPIFVYDLSYVKFFRGGEMLISYTWMWAMIDRIVI